MKSVVSSERPSVKDAKRVVRLAVGLAALPVVFTAGCAKSASTSVLGDAAHPTPAGAVPQAIAAIELLK